MIIWFLLVMNNKSPSRELGDDTLSPADSTCLTTVSDLVPCLGAITRRFVNHLVCFCFGGVTLSAFKMSRPSDKGFEGRNPVH